MLGLFVGLSSRAIRGPGSWRQRRRNRSEHGFVLVFTSITLLVLTAIGGFAVDLGHWYWTAGRLQRAADAAALAGAPYLPGDPGRAVNVAQAELVRNGLDPRLSSVRLSTPAGNDRFDPQAHIAADPLHRNVLRVEVGVTKKNFFTSLLGYDEQYLERSSVGRYKAPVPMGSPGNVLGSEPTTGDSVQDPALAHRARFMGKYWLNIAGGETDKLYGDKFTAGRCVTSDNCASGRNTDVGEDTNGVRAHRYVVHVPRGVIGAVKVQVFDGAAVDVGDYCTQRPDLGSAELRNLAIADGVNPTVYDAGPANTNCTGDNIKAQGNSTNALPKLTVTAHKPTTSRTTLGATISTTRFPGVRLDTTVASELGAREGGGQPTVRQSFRRWYTVATLSSGPGDYVIEATTPNSSIGANRFAIRVGVPAVSGWDNAQGNRVSISAKGHLTVFTNAKSDDTSFYFAKLTDGVAGRKITLNLYDIGDAPYPVDMQLVAPRGASGVAGGLGACVQNGPGLTSENHSICGVYGAVASRYNGRDVRLTLDIPETYRCADDGSDKCWMALRFKLNTTQPVSAQQPSTDTTTWAIEDCGRPVRLLDAETVIDNDDCAP